MPRLFSAFALASMIGSLVLLQACGPKKTISTPDQEIREGWTQYRLSRVQLRRPNLSVRAGVPAAPGPTFICKRSMAKPRAGTTVGTDEILRRPSRAIEPYIEEAPQNPLAAWCALGHRADTAPCPGGSTDRLRKTRSRLRGCLSELSGHACGRRGVLVREQSFAPCG